jgi:hypothetical protein
MMGAMSQDQHAVGTDPEVVEWGDDDPAEQHDHDRPSFAEIVGDPRVVTVAVTLGGLGLFGSLISQWQITSIDGVESLGATESAIRPLAVGLVELGAWGSGYLAGLFVLVAAAVLMIFGPPAGRAYARLVTLSTGGVLLALLTALLMELGENTRALNIATVTYNQELQVVVAYGRGGYCAVAGVLAVVLAAVLAGRHLPTSAAPVSSAAPDEPGPVDVRAWQRPDDDDRLPDAPYQLEVSSAAPFTPLTDPHDSYRRPDAISG